MKRAQNVLKIMAILPVILLLFSCALDNSQESSSLLIVAKISGHTDDGSDADFLESDVYEDTTATVVSDVIIATLEAKLKEPETLGPGTSYQSSILVDEYEVVYTAVDPSGSSVPETFRGSLSTVIPVDSSTNISFVIVRNFAKQDPPLSTLVASGGALQVVATITFYGEDLAGKEVQATGYLTIYFGNYAE
ncbi:MAG: hypothetical protein ISS41_05015 [Candidatus Aminicenantes bacterium]|nr:hypothetical protein [Candidatus Aminicenantes bacterium]MBL7082978.1 hypothetical protein [Candidatus Aminicenantes bacterium]